jgi:hypothetical protein
MPADTLTDEARLTQRIEELEAELALLKAERARIVSAKLASKIRTGKRPLIERGRWQSGQWKSE